MVDKYKIVAKLSFGSRKSYQISLNIFKIRLILFDWILDKFFVVYRISLIGFENKFNFYNCQNSFFTRLL